MQVTLKQLFLAWILLECAAPSGFCAGDDQRGDNRSRRPLEELKTTRGRSLPIVVVDVFGRKLPFLVNTAAPITVVDDRWRGHIRRVTEPASPDSGAIDGAPEMFEGPSISLGNLVCNPDAVMCMDLSPIRKWSGRRLEGMVGLDILAKLIVQFDLDSGMVRFFDRLPADSGERIPISSDRNGIPTVNAQIGDSTIPFWLGTGSEACLAIESSQFESFRRKELIDSCQLVPASVARGVGKQSVGFVKSIQLGPFVHERVLATEERVNSIGIGYLYRFVTTLDLSGGNLYLRPGKASDQLDQLDRTGMQLTTRERRIIIEKVAPGSPAWDAGVLDEDTLVRLDGEPVAAEAIHSVARRLERTDIQHAVHVERGRKALRFEMVSRNPQEDFKALKLRETPETTVEETFDIDSAGGPIVVPIVVEGTSRRLNVLLDTGSTHSMFPEESVRPNDAQLPPVEVVTPFGSRQVGRFRVPSISLGKVRLGEECLVYSCTSDFDPRQLDAGCDGLLGVDCLRRNVLRIDRDRGKLQILSGVPLAAR